MAIYRLLQNSAFGPEEIRCMVAAYESALLALKLRDRSDPVTEIIAKKVIAVAQTGVIDPKELCQLAIKQAGVPPRL